MADGASIQTFTKIIAEDGTYTFVSTQIENGVQIENVYNSNLVWLGETRKVLFNNLKTLTDMSDAFQKAWSELNGYQDLIQATDPRFAETASGTIIVVNEGGAEVLGRITSWSGENTWTDWQGRTVVNSDYSFNFHDENWNYFGSSGGYERTVEFEAGDRRWDGTTSDARLVIDEVGSNLNFRVDANSLDATSWNNLNPGAQLLIKLGITDWTNVAQVNIGANTWTQLDTDGATRDQVYESSNRHIDLFNQEDGNTQFAGRLEYRDGIIEVRDTNWQIVGRFLDESDPSRIMSWSDLTDPSDPAFRVGLKDAWDEIGRYLPGELRDDPDTAADERDALRFTLNDWGDLNVFGAGGEFLGRINSWQHNGVWRSNAYDETTREHVSGWTYNTGVNYDFVDAEWKHLARGGYEDRHFLSDAIIDAEYGSTAPESFDDITDPSHTKIIGKTEQSGFVVSKDDVGDTIWDSLVETAYGIPNAAAGAQGIWKWDDVSYLFIQQNTWNSYDLGGTQTDTNTQKSVEYHADGFWWEGQFVPWSQYDPIEKGHSANKESLNHARQNLGVIEYRDGFIEVRNGNWETIGRFVDINASISFSSLSALFTGLDDAWNTVEPYLPDGWDRANLRYVFDSNGNILVVDPDGILIGRINTWANEDTWTDWEGRDVVNTHYSFNFHDDDWNYFGSSGGYSRVVSFDVGDRRWDGTTADQSTEVLDETGTHLNYRVKITDQTTTEWNKLNPGSDILQKLNVTWDQITELNIGGNSWTQLDTNGATRDATYKSSNRQLELFKNNENWTEFVGRLEYREGMIEVRDVNWNLVGQFIDVDNPDGVLSWEEITNPTSENYRAGLKEAWDEIGRYLPGVLRDDPNTEIDERSALRFTINQWGDLNVFSSDGLFVARINAWEHSGAWRSQIKDSVTDDWISGWNYRTGTTYNFNDANWQNLARGGEQKGFFLSNATITSQYGDTRPLNFEDIKDPSHVVLMDLGKESGVGISKDDVDLDVWNTIIKEKYGIPTAASNAKGIWSWEDVTYIFVQDDSWTQYDVQGNALNQNTDTNIEHQTDGYWKGGIIVPWSQWDPADGAKEDLGNARQNLGVIQYRDGFIEVRDSHWELIGRFVDVSTAMTFDQLISHFQGLEEAWDSVAGYLPSDWDRTTLKFSTDSNSNIIAVDEDGVMVGRINTWVDSNSWVDWAGRDVINSNYSFNFHDADWGYYGSSGGFTREVEFKEGDRRWDDKLATKDEVVLDETGTYQNYRVQKTDVDAAKWDDLKPSDLTLAKLGITDWNAITEINIGSNTWKQLDTDGATRDEIYQNTSQQIELFKDSGDGWTQFVGRLEYRDGYIEVRDENWDTVGRILDESDPSIIFSWSDLTDPLSTHFQSGLEKAWDDVGRFLPGDFRDDTKNTPDFDERTQLSFTFDERGNLAVFNLEGKMVGRIDMWDWDGSWRTSPWDQETNKHVSGWVYSDGTNYSFNTADWNSLARAGDETHYFLTDAIIASDYSGNRPSDASGISNLENQIVLQTRQQNGYTIDKASIGEDAWRLLVEPEYGDPLSELSIEGLWAWTDITSVFVEQKTQQNFDLDGTLSTESEFLQVEYHADGFWWGEGIFVPWTEYDPGVHTGNPDSFSQTRQLYGSLKYTGGFVEARDENWTFIDREFVGDLLAPDFLGASTQAIADNWLSVFGDELKAYFNRPINSVLSVKQNADGNPVFLVDGKAVGFGQFNLNSLENGYQQYWSIGIESERGWVDIGGWNETTADPNVLGTVRHGVMFNYDYKPNDPLFRETLEAYLPPETVDLTGTPVESFDFYGVAKINAGTWYNDFNGTGQYSVRDYLRYIPEAVDGSEDWGSVIQVINQNSSFVLEIQDGSIVASWPGDITLEEPDFLGADTQLILGDWILMYGSQILSYAGITSGSVSVMQDELGNPVFLVNDVIQAVGEFELKQINGDQQYWSIKVQSPRGWVDMGGWNVVDPDTRVITFEDRRGLNFGYDINPEHLDFPIISSEVDFVRDLDLTGTVFDGIDYVNINKFFVTSWANDFYGDGGGFNVVESVIFVPDDGLGNDDWSNKLEVKLNNGIVTVGRDDIVIDSRVVIETQEPATNYLAFTRYSDIVDTLLDDENDLELASYSIINQEMLGMDVNSDAVTDFYISKGAIDGNWQPIFEADTLHQVGGLFQTAVQTFMRLPANENSFEAWLQNYTPPSDLPAGAFDQAKAQLATLMNEGYEVQVAFNQMAANPDEKSTGLVFFDASGARVGAVWFNQLAVDSFEIDLGEGNTLETSTNVYADTYSVFQDFIEFEPLVPQAML